MQVMGFFVTCHSSESLYFLYLTSLLFSPATSVYNFLPVSSLSSAFTSVWPSLDSAYEGKYGVLCFLLSLFALPHLFPFLPHHSLSYLISVYVLHMASLTHINMCPYMTENMVHVFLSLTCVAYVIIFIFTSDLSC